MVKNRLPSPMACLVGECRISRTRVLEVEGKSDSGAPPAASLMPNPLPLSLSPRH